MCTHSLSASPPLSQVASGTPFTHSVLTLRWRYSASEIQVTLCLPLCWRGGDAFRTFVFFTCWIDTSRYTVARALWACLRGIGGSLAGRKCSCNSESCWNSSNLFSFPVSYNQLGCDGAETCSVVVLAVSTCVMINSNEKWSVGFLFLSYCYLGYSLHLIKWY